MILLGILTNIGFGAYYGAMVAIAIVVSRYARHTRHEGQVRTGEDQYPLIRAWSVALLVILTVLMWIWPFQYFAFLWYVIRTGNMEFILINCAIALIKPLAAFSVGLGSVRLYEQSRPTRMNAIA
ncbi:MAG TPA: hypothetical protein VLX44_16560 [Xanthobacteraceae bacterium]|nr:hypothetical protein [Xanthobacteraceae bacterium]